MAQQHFIASGGGLGVLPHFMAHQDPRLVCVWPERHQFIRSYWLLIPYEVRRLASVRGLENAIVEMVDENRELFLPRS